MSKRATATARTVDRLRRLIIEGELHPGEALRQDDLASRLGVSRTPLREAIVQLQAEGLVVNHPHRGAVVFKPTAADLREIYEIRVLLETNLIRDAAQYVTPETTAELEELIEKMDRASNPWEFATLNRDFHLKIYTCSHKKHTIELVKGLRLKASPYVTILAGGPGKASAQQDHREILDAVRNQDGKLAASLTKAHLLRTLSIVEPMLRGAESTIRADSVSAAAP